MARKTNIGILASFLLVPYLALLLIGFLLIPDWKWMFLLLSLVPLVLIVFGLLTRRFGLPERRQKLFEIEQHLTEAERMQCRKINSRYLKLQLISYLWWILAFIALNYFSHFIGFWIAVLTPYLVMFPVLIRQQKAYTRFLLSTEYARSKGWMKI